MTLSPRTGAIQLALAALAIVLALVAGTPAAGDEGEHDLSLIHI